MKHPVRTSIVCGCCKAYSSELPSDSVNLIVTSPPYAEQRKSQYGGIHESEYADWFVDITVHFQRILTTDGSFVVNIKEHVSKGERSTYVLELILKMRSAGWLYRDGFIWVKKNPVPGGWKNRLKDAWEWCLHFSVERQIKMRFDDVMQPAKPGTIARRKNLREEDRNPVMQTGSGLGMNVHRTAGSDLARPSNVLYFSSEHQNKEHPAVFPKAIPDFFIKLLTDEEDTVFDPFAGSGTTLLAAKELNRHSIGTDVSSLYCAAARRRLGLVRSVL